MRVGLFSTYELGQQPLSLAAAARALLDAGHDVRCVDLSVEPLPSQILSWSEVMAFSVPMHTAMRLAIPVMRLARASNPDAGLACFGMYAPIALDPALGLHPDLVAARDSEMALVSWLARHVAPAIAGCEAPANRLASRCDPGRVAEPTGPSPGAPARYLLPPLDRYGRFLDEHDGGSPNLVASVAASSGCRHRCRHCPVASLYDGRMSVVAIDRVISDVDQCVALGARHISFADPDFLNAPMHARRVVTALHQAYPDITFDATVKVSHILKHGSILEEMASAGCRFVISAFESTSDLVLEKLAKGHTRADIIRAAGIVASLGIALRPSLVPFTPWTQIEDLVDLVDTIVELDLVGKVDVVQYSIRLLVPPGSLLLSAGCDAASWCGPYDPDLLSYRWAAPDPALDDLQGRLAELAESHCSDRDPVPGFLAVREEVLDTARVLKSSSSRVSPERLERACDIARSAPGPRLSESWFCCAEPTGGQIDRIRIGAEREEAAGNSAHGCCSYRL